MLSWDLAFAVHALCWTLNEAETWVKNPRQSAIQLRQQFGLIPLKNHHLPRRLWLPELLEQFMEPFGLGVKTILETAGPRIDFYTLGASSRTYTIEHQRRGEELDLEATNAEEFDLHYTLDKHLVNRIWAMTHPPQIEATFELIPAWKQAHDTLNPDTDLARSCDKFREKPEYQRVWRDWVLNEAGDYIGTRPGINKPFDFGSLETEIDTPDGSTFSLADFFSVRRRRFLPTLALAPDGAPAGQVQGIDVEYSIGDDENGDPKWEPVSKLREQGYVGILNDECGITFLGEHVPEPLYTAATQAKVRVVATVEGDTALSYLNGEVRLSVNPNFESRVLLDGRGRAQIRIIDPSSPYAEQVADGDRNSLEVNEVSDLVDLADGLLDRWNRADCTGPIVLPGLHHGGFELSDVVQGIGGRNIDLTTHHAAARYPQIVGIEYLVQSQQIVLHLDTPRAGIPDDIATTEATRDAPPRT